jgi:hypothetical protein
MPAHAWSLDVVQTIIRSSNLMFEPALASVSGADMSHFYVMAWVVHPDLISEEDVCVLPEPEEPFVEGAPPLFVWASEIIHAKKDTLQYSVSVLIGVSLRHSLPRAINVVGRQGAL